MWEGMPFCQLAPACLPVWLGGRYVYCCVSLSLSASDSFSLCLPRISFLHLGLTACLHPTLSSPFVFLCVSFVFLCLCLCLSLYLPHLHPSLFVSLSMSLFFSIPVLRMPHCLSLSIFLFVLVTPQSPWQDSEASGPSSPASLTSQTSTWLPQAGLAMEGLLCAPCLRLRAEPLVGHDTLLCPH